MCDRTLKFIWFVYKYFVFKLIKIILYVVCLRLSIRPSYHGTSDVWGYIDH